jgi:anaerobic dimethyl sulfoxide reductase subunit A
LSTPSGRIELISTTYADITGFPAIPTCRVLPNDVKYPLRLVTPHARYRINSQNSNIPWFREKEGQQLWMNFQDAEQRQIKDGQEILIFNEIGRIRINAYVSENIMPGVVCLVQGMWYSFDLDKIDSAGATNILTSTIPTEPSQGSRTHSVLVEVKPHKKNSSIYRR